MKHYDVIVIGAGAAGLAAASRLKKFNVLLLEARDRIGGRIRDLEDGIALGAEFLHGEAKRTKRLLAKAGVKIHPVRPRFFIKHHGSAVLQKNFWRHLVTGLKKLTDSERVSFAQALKKSHLPSNLKEDLTAFISGFHAADPEQVSARVVTSDLNPRSYRTARIEGGYSKILDLLKSKTPVRLQRDVVEVDWRREDIVVTARSKQGIEYYACKKLIITLPVSVLKSKHINFRPPLQKKERPLNQIELGQVQRFVLEFRKPFWKESISFFQDFEAPVPTWWTEDSSRLLVGWAGGPKAKALLPLSETRKLDQCLTSLALIFGLSEETLLRNLTGFWSHDWSKDPYSLGAYSYEKVGAKNVAKALARPLSKKLFFAGEATDTKIADGTVESALSSGYRAAKEVKEALAA